jgi:hypothetical protein
VTYETMSLERNTSCSRTPEPFAERHC